MSVCARFAKDIWPEIKTKYIDTGQVQVAFEHLPLPIHRRAQQAAESAVCAAEQQKFWPVHDQLFTAGVKLEDSDLQRYAADAGVEPKQFAGCMAERATAQVRQDADAAKLLKLSGTPSFLIGRRSEAGGLKVVDIVIGARPLVDFERAFAKVLKG